MRNDFSKLLILRGEPVVIIYRTPQIIGGQPVKTTKGRRVFCEEKIDTTARMKIGLGTKGLWNHAMQTSIDAKALFKLEDGQYLNEDSEVHNINSNEYFKMQRPRKKATHWEVTLKAREV